MRNKIRTREEVLERVEQIREAAEDDEAAHSMEDALHQDVLTTIARGTGHDASLARAALRTRELDFARWRA